MERSRFNSSCQLLSSFSHKVLFALPSLLICRPSDSLSVHKYVFLSMLMYAITNVLQNGLNTRIHVHQGSQRQSVKVPLLQVRLQVLLYLARQIRFLLQSLNRCVKKATLGSHESLAQIKRHHVAAVYDTIRLIRPSKRTTTALITQCWCNKRIPH